MSKPRIIAGSAKGRRLETPRRGTRPSPSRLREALFNMLEFRQRGRFLDLFSGSGAVGLEAASRGWQVTCVDLSREASLVIRQNAQRLGLAATVIQGDALKFASTQPQAFDVVFAAPPYPLDLNQIFQAILAARVAKVEGLYVFQHPAQVVLHLETSDITTRKYGSNALSLIEAPSLI